MCLKAEKFLTVFTIFSYISAVTILARKGIFINGYESLLSSFFMICFMRQQHLVASGVEVYNHKKYRRPRDVAAADDRSAVKMQEQ